MRSLGGITGETSHGKNGGPRAGPHGLSFFYATRHGINPVIKGTYDGVTNHITKSSSSQIINLVIIGTSSGGCRILSQGWSTALPLLEIDGCRLTALVISSMNIYPSQRSHLIHPDDFLTYSHIFPPFSRIVWFEFPLGNETTIGCAETKVARVAQEYTEKILAMTAAWPERQVVSSHLWGVNRSTPTIGWLKPSEWAHSLMHTSLRTWYFWKRNCLTGRCLTGRCCVTHDMDWWMVHHFCQCSSYHCISPLTAAALGPRQADPTPF